MASLLALLVLDKPHCGVLPQQLASNPWLPVQRIGSCYICIIPLDSDKPNLLSPHSEYCDFIAANDVMPVEPPDWQACDKFELPFWALLHLQPGTAGQPGSVQVCLQAQPNSELAAAACANITVAIAAIVDRLNRIFQLELLHDLKDASKTLLIFEADNKALELDALPDKMTSSTEKLAESEAPGSYKLILPTLMMF